MGAYCARGSPTLDGISSHPTRRRRTSQREMLENEAMDSPLIDNDGKENFSVSIQRHLHWEPEGSPSVPSHSDGELLHELAELTNGMLLPSPSPGPTECPVDHNHNSRAPEHERKRADDNMEGSPAQRVAKDNVKMGARSITNGVIHNGSQEQTTADCPDLPHPTRIAEESEVAVI